MKNLLAAAILAAGLLPASAQETPVNYDLGMQQRKAGDYAGAKSTFMSLLLQNPSGAGALEGLGLSCIALGQYEEAAVYLKQWDSVSPGNKYILGLLLRAQNGAGDTKGALGTYRELARLDPRDCAVRSKVESYSERAGQALFPRAKAYRAVSIEDLASGNPQRIIYQGSSVGSGFRTELKPGLDLYGGADLRTDIQKNEGAGFTYFELQEQAYTAGLSGRVGRGLWEAEYGQSDFRDVSSSGGSPVSIGRGRAYLGLGSSAFELGTRPKLVRVAGGGRFYRLLRESYAQAESGAARWGWDWFGRAGARNISGGRTLGNLYLRGGKDLGWSGLTGYYSHGQQEFYSAHLSGRLRYVHTDRLGASLSRGKQDSYRASVSASQTYYSDSNRLFETGASLRVWLPWQKEFSGGYRYSSLDFRSAVSGYDTLDETGHWLGAYWRRCAGRNWSADAAYEHGFMEDSLISYDVDLYTAGLEWYSDRGSLRLQGKRKATNGRGHSWSAGLQARISFR